MIKIMNNFLLVKFQISYRFLKDKRATFGNTSVRIDTFNPGHN